MNIIWEMAILYFMGEITMLHFVTTKNVEHLWTFEKVVFELGFHEDVWFYAWQIDGFMVLALCLQLMYGYVSIVIVDKDSWDSFLMWFWDFSVYWTLSWYKGKGTDSRDQPTNIWKPQDSADTMLLN